MSNGPAWRIGIVGAGSHIGRHIVRDIAETLSAKLILTSRDPQKTIVWQASDRLEVHALDLTDIDRACATLMGCEIVIFLPILTISAPVAAELRRRGSEARFILLSSNNVGLDSSAQIYRELAEAEEMIRGLAEPWAMLRPTMIYGYEGDGNISRLMQMARKWSFLPLFGHGAALQKPLHFIDLADLIVQLIEELEWRRVEVSVAGPNIVSLERLYELVCQYSGGKAKIRKIPTGMVLPVIRFFEKMRLTPPIKSAQIDRVDVDKLPTWPELEGWMPNISLEFGISVLGEEIQTKSKSDL